MICVQPPLGYSIEYNSKRDLWMAGILHWLCRISPKKMELKPKKKRIQAETYSMAEFLFFLMLYGIEII